MATRASKQVDRLRSIYPDLMQTLLSHPKTAVYAAGAKVVGDGGVGQGGGEKKGEREGDIAPMALVWAFAMVRSRAFAAGDDRFAFVPFLVSEHCSADRPLNPRLSLLIVVLGSCCRTCATSCCGGNGSVVGAMCHEKNSV